jgi:RHS repeat-associated protein
LGERCRFTSKELDAETGLYYYGARYMDPRLGKFISTDAYLERYLPTGNKEKDKKLAGHGGVFNPVNLNLYQYAGDNPLKFIDPDGNEIKIIADFQKAISDLAASMKQGGGSNTTSPTTASNTVSPCVSVVVA